MEEDVSKRLEALLVVHRRILLRESATDSVVRHSATELLSVLAECLQLQDDPPDHSTLPVDLLREVFTLLLDHLGPGDPQMRHVVLDLTVELRSAACRQVVLDWLPLVMPLVPCDHVSAHVLEILTQVLLRDGSAVTAVLGCLSSLQLSESFRSEPFHLALKGLPLVNEMDVSSVVESLLCHVSSESDATVAWEALRNEWRLLEGTADSREWNDALNPLASVADIVLSNVLRSESSDVLVRSFLSQTKESEEDSSVLSLDLIVLLGITKLPGVVASIDEMLDSWLSANTFPWEALHLLLPAVCGGSDEVGRGQAPSAVYHQLAPALLRSAIVLLLSPARVETEKSTHDNIHKYVLQLHRHLDRDRRLELVRCLLHLREEVDGWTDVTHPTTTGSGSRKRKRCPSAAAAKNGEVAICSQQAVRRLINSVLESLAGGFPSSMLRFKHALLSPLTAVTEESEPDQESVRFACRIVAKLAKAEGGLDSSEILPLLQKLLFSPSVMRSCPLKFGLTSLVERGLCLAAELVRASACTQSNQDCITGWVLRLMLPATQRMVDPALGCKGLNYFDALLANDKSKSTDVFRHLKTMLSNTGLVQLLQQYKQMKVKHEVALAYQSIPSGFASDLDPTIKGRMMIFCVAFYMRRCSHLMSPSLWSQATAWVHQLVSTYLRMGRERTNKGWQSRGWLMAPFELPLLRFPITTPSLSKLERHLSSFDLKAEAMDTKGAVIDECMLSNDLSIQDVHKLVNALQVFEVSLWFAIALSLAVLQSSLPDFQSQLNKMNGDSTTREFIKLVQFQQLKLYCIRSKVKAVEQTLACVRLLLTRKIGSPKPARISDNEIASSDLEVTNLLSSIDRGANAARELDCTYFGSRAGIPMEVLLMTFCNDDSINVIQRALSKLASSSAIVTDDLRTEYCFMKLNSALADHLESLCFQDFRHQDADKLFLITANQVCFTFRLSNFLTSLLPVLRKRYFAYHRAVRADGISYEEIMSFAESVLSLLKGIVYTVIRSRDARSSNFSRIFVEASQMLSLPNSLRNSDAAEAIFDLTKDMLRASDSLPPVFDLLEVLAIIAIRGDFSLVEKAISEFWLSLHTIYALSDSTKVSRHLLVLRYIREDRRVQDCTIRSRLFEETLGSLCIDDQVTRYGLSLYREMLVQYFALICISADLVARNTSNLGVLVDAAFALYKSPGEKKHSSEEKIGPRPATESIRTPTQLPFLTYHLSEEYFELLLQALVGMLAICSPSTRTLVGKGLGPFVHIGALLHLVRRLVQLYLDKIDRFSRRSAPVIFDASRCAVQATLLQLEECMVWRSSQPLPRQKKGETTTYDPGSTVYLRRLLDRMGELVGTLFDLCECWQMKAKETRLISKSTGLQKITDKALRAINRAADQHNWARPSRSRKTLPQDDLIIMEVSSVLSDEANRLPPTGSPELPSKDWNSPLSLSASDVDDSDVSFCALGTWGNDASK